jgi:hypothetical protein
MPNSGAKRLICLQSYNYRLYTINNWMGLLQLHTIHTNFLNMRLVGSKIWIDIQTDKHTHIHTCMCMHTAAAWWFHGPHSVHCRTLLTLFYWDKNYSKNGITHFLRTFLLTLSARVEYMYSAASRTSCPDGVLVLRDFHKVIKWPGTVDFKV